MHPQPALSQISAVVFQDADQYRDAFLNADPFKHAVIEDFFEPAFAERLLAEFPSFDAKLALNEMGELGGKAVNTNIRKISPAYQELYDTIGGQPFLDLMSRVSGIPDLILDPKMFGGGTHDNRHGQDLDVHVDFNYDEARQLHRRLNVIVYLNKGWKTEWGGAIEIHSNPHDPEHNRIHAFDPTFNRCVMFETNEYSWHGFPRINLPEDQRHLSRKSISIYLYTKERPAGEIAPMHGTFYVQRPLPERFQAGYALTSDDVKDLKELLARRDMWIRQYHKMELQKNRDIAERDSCMRAPLTGYALQPAAPKGVFHDQWVCSRAEVRIRPIAPVDGLLLRGWRPENSPAASVRIAVGDQVAESAVKGEFQIDLDLPGPAREEFTVTIDTRAEGRAVDSAEDVRDLQFLITELRARHPLLHTLMRS